MKKDEVEEFLRRAAQRRAQAEAQRRAQAKPPAGPVQPPPAQPPQRAPTARLVPSMPPDGLELLQPIDAEIVDLHPVQPTNRISTAIQPDLGGSRQIGQRASQFGVEVGMADDNLEAHLHQTFDHKLGRLKKDAIEGGPPPATAQSSDTRISAAAASIAQMLSSPLSLRQAIILKEILTRPDHLW